MHKYKRHLISLLIVLLALPILLKVTGIIFASFSEEPLMRLGMAASYQPVLLQPLTESDIQVADADYSDSIGLGTQPSLPNFQNDITALILSDAGWSKSLKLFLSTEVQNIQNKRSSLDIANANVSYGLQLSRFIYAPAPQELDKQIQVWDAGYIDNDINLVSPSLDDDIATIADIAVPTPSALLSPTSTDAYMPTPSSVVTATLTLVPTNTVISEPTITDMPSPSVTSPIISITDAEESDGSVLIFLIIILVTGAIIGTIIYKLTRKTVNISTNPDDTYIASNVSIRKTLAGLYSDVESMRRVARDAELNIALISFSSVAMNTWESILLEAERANKIDKLLNRVLSEYPNSKELLQVVNAYDDSGASK